MLSSAEIALHNSGYYELFGAVESALEPVFPATPWEQRSPEHDEQCVIYDVMRDHFSELLGADEAVCSRLINDETIYFLMAFKENGLEPEPVELLSRVALRDAAEVQTVIDALSRVA